MLTKVQYDYLKPDLVLAGVWDTIVKESPLGGRLDWKQVANDIVKYNVELTMPTVNWLQPRDQITENTGTVSQRTTNLYTLIGDADTDKSMIAMNPLQNPEAIDIEAKAKAMAHAFETAFILGQTSTQSNAKEFKGLLRIIAEFESATTTDLDGLNNSQVIWGANAASGALTMAAMDQLIDAVKPGKPDLLLMSRMARRKLNALQRASGSGVEMINPKEFGMFMPQYDGIPILVSDFIPDNFQDGASSVLNIAAYDPAVARASGYDNTVIFAMKLSPEDVTGLQAGVMIHERETFIEDYNAIRNRFSWNVSAMCKKKFSLAVMINVQADA
jgi:hypothetical protein